MHCSKYTNVIYYGGGYLCVEEDTCVCGGGYERTCAIARMGWLLLLRAFAGLLTEG